MLVEYTPISSLNAGELAALKAAVKHQVLEGRGTHFVFQGKTFSMNELRAAQSRWLAEDRGPGKQLLNESTL